MAPYFHLFKWTIQWVWSFIQVITSTYRGFIFWKFIDTIFLNETNLQSTHSFLVSEPTPKSILKKTGKKGSLQNRRLTLKFFDVPKKKGYIGKLFHSNTSWLSSSIHYQMLDSVYSLMCVIWNHIPLRSSYCHPTISLPA